jgi:hypothetical protein
MLLLEYIQYQCDVIIQYQRDVIMFLSDYLNGLIKYCKCYILSLTIMMGCGIFNYDDNFSALGEGEMLWHTNVGKYCL